GDAVPRAGGNRTRVAAGGGDGNWTDALCRPSVGAVAAPIGGGAHGKRRWSGGRGDRRGGGGKKPATLRSPGASAHRNGRAPAPRAVSSVWRRRSLWRLRADSVRG